MIKHFFLILFSIMCCFQSVFATEKVASGLEVVNPQLVNLVYTIEPESIDKGVIESIVNKGFSTANIKQVQREDAQLFLRVEEHAGEYLLYLDFSRKVQYWVGAQSYRKDAFVWGRYVKDISDLDELYDDVEYVLDEFVEAYLGANGVVR